MNKDIDNKYDQSFKKAELGVKKENESFDPKLEADEDQERSYEIQSQQHEPDNNY